MSQNTSHAVMAQRVEAHDSLDDFPTMPWGTRALCTYVIDIRGCTVWEPAANRGYMVRPLREFAQYVIASDIHDYGHSFPVQDFLWPTEDYEVIDWVITNPPFRLAEQFIRRGLEIANRGVAVLVRTSFIESIGRYESLYRDRPPSIMGQFVERLPMVKGRIEEDASTATSYCWLVWYREPPYGGCRLVWIPPCRSKLERAGDYEQVAA